MTPAGGARRRSSISARLTLGACVLVALALVVGGVAITVAMRRFVRVQVDQRLDLQLSALTAALRPGADGRLELAGGVDAPPFDRDRGGWAWRVEAPQRRFTSRSLVDATLALEPAGPSPGHDHPHPGPSGVLAGEAVVSRISTTERAGQPVTLIATAPVRALRDPLLEVVTPAVLTLFGLGLLLGVGAVVLLRLGLRPLAAVRRAVEEVRLGRRERVPDGQPRELAPLVDELNALLAENAEGLRRARSHVANLGHALKTPLTSLALALRAEEPAGSARLRLIDEMERCVRHHLGRARAGAAGAPLRVRTPVRPRVDDIVGALRKIYAARELELTVDVDAAAAVACEPQDVDEMLGNLLDNACKWAARGVRVGAVGSGRTLVITVEDDGAGLSPERAPEALLPGRRLDESVPGDGFGLSICRELAELYGGALQLERSPLGGLAARLGLPSAVEGS